MSVDISGILKDWPYEPGRLTARRIRGLDGREKIQLRLDLGLLQMEATGRPDGQRPHGCESLLDYYERQRDEFSKRHGPPDGFRVDARACEQLRAEALLYYHRYIAEFVLEDFSAVERDTARNLRLLDFCAAHAAQPMDRLALEPHRAYIMMMRTRARCQGHLSAGRDKEALAAVKRGIAEITEHFQRHGQEQAIESSAELAILKELAGDIEARQPVDPVAKLERALAEAVATERYEEAAAIRDRLRRLTGQDDRPHHPPRA